MNNHVAVYVNDSGAYEQLKQASDKSNFIMDLRPKFSDVEKDHFIICDVNSFLEMQEDLSSVKKQYLYIISPLSDEENMKLIEEHHLCHLVGMNDGVYGEEVIANISKTFSKKIWGVNAYMEDHADVRILSLSDSKFTNEMINEALKNFDFQDYFSSPIEYLQVMANELISNSLYKGPNKRRQEQGLDSPDRKSTVFLKNSDLVQVTLGMGTKGISLAVQDSFGGLSYDILIASLMRSFREKTVMEKKDGAGLGLYLTFLHSNQFIVNYRENFRTEVICIIDKNKRYKNYKQRIRSFHFFQEVPGEKVNH